MGRPAGVTPLAAAMSAGMYCSQRPFQPPRRHTGKPAQCRPVITASAPGLPVAYGAAPPQAVLRVLTY